MYKLFIRLLTQITDGIVMFDTAGKVIFNNLENSRFESIVVDKSIAYDSIMEAAITVKDGDSKELRLSLAGLVEDDNKTIVFRDDDVFCLYIQDMLAKPRYDVLRENMLELINHELRTPLQSFVIGASLVAERIEEETSELKAKDARDFSSLVDITVDNAKKLTTKMERLLDLSIAYGSEPIRSQERINLVEVSYDAIDSLKELSLAKNIIVNLDLKSELVGSLYGSSRWLTKAVEECVRNSIDRSNQGAEIRVELEQNGYFAHIVIRDSGPSIDPQLESRLYEPFIGFAEKMSYGEQGLGIGLSLAKKIIENHGGNIKHIGNQNGVDFHLELPTGGSVIPEDVNYMQARLYARDLSLLLKDRAQSL